jgi:HSP20 family molecular chaperone IbpA
MTSSTLIPLITDKNDFFRSSRFSSNRYSIHDYGQGYRTYTYEFDLIDFEPEQITVLLDKHGRLRIRAYRPLCHEFRREYIIGGPDVETRLVRNTIDTHGHLRVDVDVYPRPYNISSINNNNILTFDLQGYRPKNINVRINENGLLKINARHTDENFGHLINREYYRQYQLPKTMNPDQIRARIDENQILTIELPHPLPQRKPSWLPYHPTDYSKKRYANSHCCIM